MSFNYQNPTAGNTTTGPWSVTSLDRDYGTNFSVYNIGGYMEVQNLSDLEYTYSGSGQIFSSGNTIPIRFYKSPNVLPDKVFLWNDGISSGRRRLGMLVYVQENQTTYQYTIDNYETLYNNADSAGCIIGDPSTDTYLEVRNKVGITPNAAGQALMDVWTGSTIEGQNGVTRENATWRVFWGTDWQITGGTYNSGNGTLSLDNNTGGTINVTGFTSGGGTDYFVTGGTYSSGSTTLTLTRNDGNTVDVTGFTSGGGGSQNLQQVLDTGNVSTTGMYISGATLSATTVDINGGTIDNVALGSTNPVSLVSNSVDINGGTIDNTTIGAQVRSTGAFTYIYDNNGLTGNTGQILSTSTTGITWIDSSSTDYYVTGGTYNSGTTTLTLSRNDGNTVDVTGFTSGGGGSLTLQDVTDNGSTTTRAISVRSVTSEFDLTINEGITAGNGGGDISSNTVFGANALDNNSSGNGNSAFGTWTLSATTGSGNSAFGSLALYKNITGNNNTAIGKNAMYNGTTSLENVAVGSEAFYNGGGSIGVAIGYQAGYEVTTASGSILIGYRAGYDITDNSRNIAIGYESLRFNDEGTFNVAVGDTALHGNRSGDFNVAIGNDALVSNTTGLRNVGVGADSLSTNQTGSDNIALGFEAGQNVANGNGGLNGTSNDSIFIGKGSKASVNNGSNEIVIGTDAIGNGSNTITLGNTGHTDTYLFGTIHGVPYLTGGTLINNTLTLVDVDGGSFDITGFTSTSSDTYVTGGTITYNSTGDLDLSLNNDSSVNITGLSKITGATLVGSTLTLSDNLGNDIDVSGFTTTSSDTYVTGATYTESTGILSLERNDGNNVGVGGWSYVKSITENGNNLTVTLNDGNVSLLSIEAITGLGYNDWGITGSTTGGLFYNGTELPFITGGSYNSGTVTLNINGGVESNIQISGFDSDDTYLTGATYTPTTLTLGMNDGSEFNVGGFAPEITGGTYSSGTITLNDNTDGSIEITGITFSSDNIYNTDGQLGGDRVIDQNSNSLTFSGGSVSMGTETTSPVCALLELASTNQGLLIPRMTQVQRLAISTPVPGLLVYCTNTDSNGEEGMYMYKSQGWVNVL